MILASIVSIAVSIALFTSFVVVVARLGGSAAWLANVWSAPTLPDRPCGMQEEDLPPFVFRDAQPVA